MNAIKTRENTIFQIICYVVLGFATICIIVPFYLMIVASFTDDSALFNHGYSFWPEKWSLNSYEYIWQRRAAMGKAYLITVGNTAVGTAISLTIGSLLAYPLSRRELRGRSVFLFLVVFTILFHGGLTPTYLVWTQIFHIKNTYLAYILPKLLLRGMHVLLMKNYFQHSIPHEIIESAYVDGASEMSIFRKIIMPLSLPILATIGLLVGLADWNDWENGLYYITKYDMYSYQLILNQMLTSVQYLAQLESAGLSANTMPSSDGMRMAIATLGLLPILMVYPFFQRYFVKGINIGAVKG